MSLPHLSVNYYKQKGVNLIRIASILLLVGFSILLIPMFLGVFITTGLYGYGIYFAYIILGFLRVPASILIIAGIIVLLVGVKKLANLSSEANPKKLNIAFILLLLAIIFDTIFEVLMFLDLGWRFGDFFNFMPIITAITVLLFFASFYFLGFGIKEMKNEFQIDNKMLITPYIYSFVVAFQLIGLIFKFMTSSGFPYSYFYYTYYYYTTIVTVIFVYVIGTIDIILKIVIFSEVIKETGKLRRKLLEINFHEQMQLQQQYGYQQQYGSLPQYIVPQQPEQPKKPEE
ncbi:MAG: hypothetical protein ACTSSH_04675 [Candidatus Heimdallarchaeota archaeon]